MKNLQNIFSADAQNAHHNLKEKHRPVLMCIVRLCEVFLDKCWR